MSSEEGPNATRFVRKRAREQMSADVARQPLCQPDAHGVWSVESEAAAPSDEDSMCVHRGDASLLESAATSAVPPPEPVAPAALPRSISCFSCLRNFSLHSTGLTRHPQWPWLCHTCEPGPELVPYRERLVSVIYFFLCSSGATAGVRDDDDEE